MKRFLAVVIVAVAAYFLFLKKETPKEPSGATGLSPSQPSPSEPAPPPPQPPPPPTKETPTTPLPLPLPLSAVDAALEKASDLETAGKREDAWVLLSGAWKTAAAAEERKRLAERLNKIGPALALGPAKVSIGEIHTVAKGDGYEKLAKKYAIGEEFIRRMNNRKGDLILAGEQLKVIKGPPEIVVSKSEFTLTVLLQGRFVKQWTVGIGKEDRTPEGTFTIEKKQKNPEWTFQGKVHKFGAPENILGTRWMGFKNTPEHSGFGIHGSKEGEGVGSAASNGCVRMRNADVEDLFGLVPMGTQVVIKP